MADLNYYDTVLIFLILSAEPLMVTRSLHSRFPPRWIVNTKTNMARF